MSVKDIKGYRFNTKKNLLDLLYVMITKSYSRGKNNYIHVEVLLNKIRKDSTEIDISNPCPT